MTRTCLGSPFSRTELPNHEVVNVDDGSSDGTPEYLATLATRHPNVRLILNPGNRGFVAAAPQGLAGTRGHVLVLLNQDLMNKARFVCITSAGLRESQAHDVVISNEPLDSRGGGKALAQFAPTPSTAPPQ